LKKDKTENQSMTFINIHKNESGQITVKPDSSNLSNRNNIISRGEFEKQNIFKNVKSNYSIEIN
jgi:hypothetical protein